MNKGRLGLCSKHYSRLNRHGDVHAAGKDLRVLWADPTFRLKNRAAVAEARRSKSSRHKTALRSKEQWAKLSSEERLRRTAAARNSVKRVEHLRVARQSPEQRALTSQRSLEQWAKLDSEARARRLHNALTANPSSLERIVEAWLQMLGVAYQTQTRLVNRYHVDFYVKDKKLVIECDGKYWHAGRQDHDTRRDADLRDAGYWILRLPEIDIRSGKAFSILQQAVLISVSSHI